MTSRPDSPLAPTSGLVAGTSATRDRPPAAPGPTAAPEPCGASGAGGISSAEADSLRRAHGWNEVAGKRTNPVLGFLRRFWGVPAWLLEAILVLSAALGKTADVVLVALLLVVNAIVGFAQERRAAGVVETLEQRLEVSVRVLRDGSWKALPARELVPGDVVRVRTGDVVAADARLLDGSVAVDSSALTGESALVARVAGDELLSGSVVRRGEGTAVVVRTGAAAAFGRTAQLVDLARPRLHVEEVVAGVVWSLMAIVVVVLAVLVALTLLRGGPLLEIAPLTLVLLMSAVPVALPVMFTVTMALGARELARRGVLVTRLSAAEDAATMDVLCVDKTGTITSNRQAVTGVLALGAATDGDVLRAGALASEEANQDPIDLAFLAAARERGALSDGDDARVASFTPFDASTRRTEAVVVEDGQRVVVMKGAVRTVGGACGLGAAAIEDLEAKVREATRAGARSLAVARGREGGRPVVLGLVTLQDPPRADAKELIARLRDAGVSVKMLTGDALPVAAEIARQVGLGRVERAADLASAGEAATAGADLLAGADGLAEVYPEDKYRIVERLQAAGHVTGMTGDGVNDAPALRQAEVGIAVRDATDVAKGAASVVLTDPGLANIVTLVVQGRIIFQRVLTWIINKISQTILKAAFVAIAFVVTGKFVVSAFAMLLLVFLGDFSKISLATDVVQPSRRPETWRIGGFVAAATVLGAAMTAEALAALVLAWPRFGLAGDDGALHTFSFLVLLYFADFFLLSARERGRFWKTRPSPALAAALAAELAIGTLAALLGPPGLAPLPWGQVVTIFVYVASCCLAVNDALKVVLMRRAAGSAAG